jgi:hypothetical protein
MEDNDDMNKNRFLVTKEIKDMKQKFINIL